MRKSKFSESQIVGILKEGEAGLAVAELYRKHGMSAATYYAWKSQYAGASVSDLVRMKELEAENTRLKRMYADLALENAAIKDGDGKKILMPSVRREMACELLQQHMPITRACPSRRPVTGGVLAQTYRSEQQRCAGD